MVGKRQTNLTDGVKSEPSQNVLQIQDGVSPDGVVKQGKQTEMDFIFKRLDDEFPQRLSRKFVTRQLALRGPQLAVDVENATAEEIAEYISERLPLGVIHKISLEHVLDIGRVGRDDGPPRTEPVHDDGPRRGVGKQVGVPGEKAAAVFVERKEAADERVGRRGKALRRKAVEFKDTEIEEKESP